MKLADTARARANALIITLFFRRLGFVIHSVKSVLRSTHTVTYLGFEINSESMTVSLMQERKERILAPVINLLHQDMSTVRQLVERADMEMASFQGVKYRAPWYKSMKNDRIRSLK